MPEKDIVVLLLAAKQNALFWCYLDVLTLVLPDQNAECKPNELLHRTGDFTCGYVENGPVDFAEIVAQCQCDVRVG